MGRRKALQIDCSPKLLRHLAVVDGVKVLMVRYLDPSDPLLDASAIQ